MSSACRVLSQPTPRRFSARNDQNTQHKLGCTSLVAAQCLTDSDAKFHMRGIPQFAKLDTKGQENKEKKMESAQKEDGTADDH